MDPNLEKIRDSNRKFIQKGKLAVPIIHAKSYLFNMLGEGCREQIETELAEFVEEIKKLQANGESTPQRKKPNRRHHFHRR